MAIGTNGSKRIFAFRQNRERAFAIICVVQILVLVLAASGVLAGH
jgi:hypothetical protein